MNVLVIGGSGFLSGAVVREALDAGHRVWIVTRGQRAAPEGVTAICADRRDRDAMAAAIAAMETRWDLVVDCIGYEPDDARQDVELFRERADHLVFVSTDFVFDPRGRTFPQRDDNPHFLTDDSYGAKKRRCERVLLDSDLGGMAWTVVRPCHIYGPGSPLGCLPAPTRDPAADRQAASR